MLAKMKNSCLSHGSEYVVKPDVFSYNAILSAYALCDPDKANMILVGMEDSENTLKCVHVKPNAFCYTTCMNGYAKSGLRDKGRKAYELLQRMKSSYKSGNTDAKPNVVAYTAVINACAYCSVPSEASVSFDIACDTFEELLVNPEYGRPNQATYAQMLTALSKLLPSTRSRSILIRKIFSQCCRDGQVSKLVYHIYLRSAAIKSKALTYRNLPDEYKQNINLKRPRKKKESWKSLQVISVENKQLKNWRRRMIKYPI